MKGTTNVPEVAVIIRQSNNILFVLREKTGYADGMYALPGGHVEKDESFSAAAAREALEEVNVRINGQDLRAVHMLQRIKDHVRVAVIFEASKWTGEPKSMEPDRHGPIAWFDAGNLPYDTIIPFQAEALQALASGKIYTELGWQ